jgi:hypothetical protein
MQCSTAVWKPGGVQRAPQHRAAHRPAASAAQPPAAHKPLHRLSCYAGGHLQKGEGGKRRDRHRCGQGRPATVASVLLEWRSCRQAAPTVHLTTLPRPPHLVGPVKLSVQHRIAQPLQTGHLEGGGERQAGGERRCALPCVCRRPPSSFLFASSLHAAHHAAGAVVDAQHSVVHAVRDVDQRLACEKRGSRSGVQMCVLAKVYSPPPPFPSPPFTHPRATAPA